MVGTPEENRIADTAYQALQSQLEKMRRLRNSGADIEQLRVEAKELQRLSDDWVQKLEPCVRRLP